MTDTIADLKMELDVARKTLHWITDESMVLMVREDIPEAVRVGLENIHANARYGHVMESEHTKAVG